MFKFLLGVSLSVGAMLAAMPGVASAEPLTVRGTLDMTRYGANAPYDLAVAGEYISPKTVNLTWDPSKGSQDAITRVAGGAYDIGVADLSTLIEFASKNPEQAPKVVFITMARSPKLIMTKKSSNIKEPKDLIGKTLASGQTDGASKIYPLFLAKNGLDETQVKRQIVDIRLRDAMLPRGEVDGVICYDYTTVFNLKKVGVKIEDLSMMYFWDSGLDPYGVSVIASQKFINEHPEALKEIVKGIAQAWSASATKPETAIDVIAKIEPTVNKELELDRLKWVMKTSVVTDVTRKEGIGAYDPARMQATINEVASGFKLERKPTVAEVYDDRFLPALDARAVPQSF